MFEKDSLEIQSKVLRGLEAAQGTEKAERTLTEMRDRERELTR